MEIFLSVLIFTILKGRNFMYNDNVNMYLAMHIDGSNK